MTRPIKVFWLLEEVDYRTGQTSFSETYDDYNEAMIEYSDRKRKNLMNTLSVQRIERGLLQEQKMEYYPMKTIETKSKKEYEESLDVLLKDAKLAQDNNDPSLSFRLYSVHDMFSGMFKENEMLAPHLESLMENKNVEETIKWNIAIWLGHLN